MAPTSRLGGRALADLLPDLARFPGPRYQALADAVIALVRDGRVAPETRVPSERELAGALQLSRATVTAAYDALRSAGFLRSRTGSGSFVAIPRGTEPRTALASWADAGLDVLDLSRATLPAPPEVLAAALEAARQLPDHAVGDGYQPAGLTRLRQAVAQRFTDRGVPTRTDQILITNGAQHGWDLTLRLLAGPGDRVVTELPTYPGALDAIRTAGLRVVPVPMAAGGGWSVDQLRATLRQTAPRLAYLMPDHHNPTGALVDEAARRAVLRSAREAGTTVVIDESFVELGFVPPGRPTAAIDSHVVTIGSLSKAVWGGLRIGWVRAHADLICRLAAVRAATDMAGAVLEQLLAAELLPQLPSLTATRVAQLHDRRDALLAALADRLPEWRPVPALGGLSLWVELDAPLSTPLSLLAARAGVVVVPGPRFGVDGTLERFLRLPFARPAEQLDEAVARLAGVWHGIDRTAVPAGQLVVA